MSYIKFSDGKWVEKAAFLFHIVTKNQLREIIDNDEDKTGVFLDKLAELPVDPRWATCEPGDGGMVKGEDFINAMLNNYIQMVDKYGKGQFRSDEEFEKTKSGIIKAGQMALAVYRNDSAYFERLGGMISFLVANQDKLKKIANVDQEHSAILEGLYRWWKTYDKRLRSKPWIDGAFRIVIKKYKTDLFYRRSINMCLMFISNNANFWKDDETFHPDNWFPKNRGKFCNAMFGWRF